MYVYVCARVRAHVCACGWVYVCGHMCVGRGGCIGFEAAPMRRKEQGASKMSKVRGIGSYRVLFRA